MTKSCHARCLNCIALGTGRRKGQVAHRRTGHTGPDGTTACATWSETQSGALSVSGACVTPVRDRDLFPSLRIRVSPTPTSLCEHLHGMLVFRVYTNTFMERVRDA